MRRLRLFTTVIVLLLALMLASCAEKQQEGETTSEMNVDTTADASLAALEWMLGTWRTTGGETASYEEWIKVGATEFSGRGFRIKGADTSITELLTLTVTDSGTFYIAEVAHNPEPTYFRMSGSNETMVVFENPMHDFPNRIQYHMASPDSLVAIVEGQQESGDSSGFEIRFERVKQ